MSLNRTTGWTENTRNLFHPGDIILALRRDFPIYSPYKTLGLLELIYHFKDEGREEAKRYLNNKGKFFKLYYESVVPAQNMQEELRKRYPEIAKFSDSLSTRNLFEISQSAKKIKELIVEIENKFGNTIEVQPFKEPYVPQERPWKQHARL